MPTFIAARLPFLDEESIEEISRANLERRRLEALRKRLHDYRVELRWPASEETRRVFENILRMLVNFVRYHPEFYGTVRDELVAWILHDSDRSLSKTAEKLLFELAGSFEATLVPTRFNPDSWEGKVVFQEGLSTAEVARLERILVGTTLLAQAVALTHDTETFDIDRVGKDGVWVSRTSSLHRHSSYRVSINTEPGKHFDLQLVVPEDIGKRRVLSSIYWTIGLHSHPFIRPAVAHLGCWRPELGAIVLEHVSDLNTWERIREFASIRPAGVEFPTRDDWRKLFVKAMSTFFLGWLASERRIVPGAVDPSNVMVPEPDFREGALILSLNDFGPYKGPLSLVGPLIRNFYVQTFCHFPWSRRWLDHAWIFDACCEALGSLEGREFLEQLRREIGDTPLPGQPGTWADAIESYLDRLGRSYHVPIALHCAVERFQRWKEVNPHATADACDQIIGELYRLYELHRFPELMRYHLYRHTYFAEADRATDLAFDRLLARMARQPGHKASSMVELSDLQATLSRPEDQAAFGRLVFPRSQPSQRIELMAVGEGAGRQVIVLSHIKDGQGLTYSVREPIDAAEVGKLYR
ncbi:MAG: hypothetical protein HY815_26840, partial [Candidatus Riflebacteria bacterium]|nr:hypothetical protein [Candidatus Riflebacteria bacterium]